MKQIVIENPILNSPFDEPLRHFKFTDEGITKDVIEQRRVSSYFMPIPKSRKRSKAQLSLNTEWTEDRIQENQFINQIRGLVSEWRKTKYAGVTRVSKRLLDYWKNPNRNRRLFFCQIEALETLIFITEIAPKNAAWILNQISQYNQDANPLLNRIAFKMATGSGKTVVMGMTIAWHCLNKLADPMDTRFSDTFLIVTPGITIRDRLRVLLPNDPENYYLKMDLVPSQDLEKLGHAKIIITNFHGMKLRETVKAGKLTKAILRGNKGDAGGISPFTETPDQMVRRVCRELGNKKNLIIINDEAHHCYRRRPEGEIDDEPLSGEEGKEAEKRNEEARVWISGLEAIQSKLGIRAIYDLSATPFFLHGSGYVEGTLFPWVVSDFSLVDAIESGIVKVPRVPVSDDSGVGEQPTYRDLWLRIRDKLPKKKQGTDRISGPPQPPLELEGALLSLYEHYEKSYKKWEENSDARKAGLTPPVFIVVCNNTNVSKLVYDYIAGWEKPLGEDKTVPVPGRLKLFSNVEGGNWLARPNTILVDSEQLESGEELTPEFKKIASIEIEEFKADYQRRFPGRSADQLTDADILREVMNTVGKEGKLGENVKCVVSVSMLTEGWDANTVTHILGVRAFGTQLLCEQVVGRGLRRMSYVPNDEMKFDPEYAEVYGVPFSFIPCSGSAGEIKLNTNTRHVHAMEDRKACEITFPRVTGYRFILPPERYEAKFSDDSRKVLSTQDLPSKTEVAPIVGEVGIHTLDKLKDLRDQQVQFYIARRIIDKFFKEDDSNRPWLFPNLLEITKRWYEEYVVCKDNTFKQLLYLTRPLEDAAEKIYRSIVRANDGEKTLFPILQPYDTIGSTSYVDFKTAKPVYETNANKCHINFMVADTRDWEQKLTQTIEDMDEVLCYVKNDQHLNFTIPYVHEGQEHVYIPDFILRVKDHEGESLNLILEVTGEMRPEKVVKVSTAKTLWVPAINNHGGYGRWAFLEIKDPWSAKSSITDFLLQVNLPLKTGV